MNTLKILKIWKVREKKFLSKIEHEKILIFKSKMSHNNELFKSQ
jgi:hypothetical protein